MHPYHNSSLCLTKSLSGKNLVSKRQYLTEVFPFGKTFLEIILNQSINKKKVGYVLLFTPKELHIPLIFTFQI